MHVQALAGAQRAIHDNDIVALKRLLADHAALLSWEGDERYPSLMEMATDAYGDAFGPEREHWFTRGTCAELLIDAGAIVLPRVPETILRSRAVGLLHMFDRKRLLPQTLMFRVALGQLDRVRSLLGESAYDGAALREAFICACRFEYEEIASLLLERAIALDPELGQRIDATTGRGSFVRFFIEPKSLDFDHSRAPGLWQAFVVAQLVRSVHDQNRTTFENLLESEPWLLGDDYVWLQHDLINKATLSNDRIPFIRVLFEHTPAILRRSPPPPSDAIANALTYKTTDLIPLLTRIWPIPDDLPHVAGLGRLERVKQWFDESGAPAQHVLDTALAFAVINGHFDVADVLLAHGADINTQWNSHEPASILHHLVFVPDPYTSMQFLIDRGIDMRIRDYRWNSTPAGWARVGKNDAQMAEWLEEAERRQRG